MRYIKIHSFPEFNRGQFLGPHPPERAEGTQPTMCSAEQVELVLFLLHNFLFLLCLFLAFVGCSGSLLSGAGVSNSGGARVLQCLSLLEDEARSQTSGGQVLEGIEHEVLSGVGDDEAGTKRERGHVLAVSLELFKDVVGGDVEHLRFEDRVAVEHLQDVHLVLEGPDLELIKEHGLTRGDLVTVGDDLDGIHDFDLTLDDLGLNVQSLEEGGLLRVHTSGTGRNGNIGVSDGTDLGGGLTHLRVDDLLQVLEVAVGEDHTHVQVELIQDQLDVDSVHTLGLVLILEFGEALAHQSLYNSGLACQACRLHSFP